MLDMTICIRVVGGAIKKLVVPYSECVFSRSYNLSYKRFLKCFRRIYICIDLFRDVWHKYILIFSVPRMAVHWQRARLGLDFMVAVPSVDHTAHVAA